MSATTILGAGTVTVGTAPLDFSCEVIGAKVTHGYNEIQAGKFMLCGDSKPARTSRADGFSADLENDLSAAGLYAYLHTNDMTVASFEFVPNTVDGASWAGSVTLALPSEIGADEFGAPIASSIEWAAVGLLTFTPSTVTVP